MDISIILSIFSLSISLVLAAFNYVGRCRVYYRSDDKVVWLENYGNVPMKFDGMVTNFNSDPLYPFGGEMIVMPKERFKIGTMGGVSFGRKIFLRYYVLDMFPIWIKKDIQAIQISHSIF